MGSRLLRAHAMDSWLRPTHPHQYGQSHDWSAMPVFIFPLQESQRKAELLEAMVSALRERLKREEERNNQLTGACGTHAPQRPADQLLGALLLMLQAVPRLPWFSSVIHPSRACLEPERVFAGVALDVCVSAGEVEAGRAELAKSEEERKALQVRPCR